MKSTQPKEPRSGRNLEAAHDIALFLDVDGTLLRIAETPDAVEASQGLGPILDRTAAVLGGALALVSGRRIADLDRIFAPLELPSAGIHGLERRDATGLTHRIGRRSDLDDLRPALEAFAASHPGVMLEDKGRALALHYRKAQAAEADARRLIQRLVADRGDRLRVLEGRKIIEVLPNSSHKGRAIAAFMGERPFAGRRPVFVGDDATDEDGFAVVNDLGGASVKVGNTLESRATHRLSDVDAVLTWLARFPGTFAANRDGRGT